MARRGQVAPDGTPWRIVPGLAGMSTDVLAETLDGGQAFRWTPQTDRSWIGIWGRNVVRIRVGPAGDIEWSALAGDEAAVTHYFGAEADLPGATDALPWRSDAHLARCIQAFPGLRILRQQFGETLLCFLCSATKQIVQIKQMVALLAERHGERIAVAAADRGRPGSASPATAYYALPTWEKLATIPERELRDCLLGFRAKYIAETATLLARHPGWLAETENLPYTQAKERLCSLPGVGEKIADCVLLFGAGKLEAFPVDVWILRTLALRYDLHGWKPAALSQFGRAHFGAYAGLAQQFLFAWERRLGRSVAQGTVAAPPSISR